MTLPVTYIRVPDTRAVAGDLASEFYGHPSHRLRAVGVTGTSGKTTTTLLIDAILAQAGYRTGLIGTLKIKLGDQELPVTHTTPESVDLQAISREMADAGTDYLVMEVSSHALELHRVKGMEYDIGVFTNLSREHLDFHLTMENYLKAKTKLFQSLAETAVISSLKSRKCAVINSDDPGSAYIITRTKVPVLTYGVKGKANIWASDVLVKPDGVSFTVATPLGTCRVQMRITGLFNVYNALAAIGVGVSENIPLSTIKQALEIFPGVPGRFELVDGGQDFAVIVDYAHKPDGLENILRTARGVVKGKLIVVFGCGGDRDRTKRPVMGEIAGRLADYTIVTSDNPRSEDPDAIIAEIVPGLRQVTEAYAVEPDRKAAITQAIGRAKPGDAVIIAGKGHETYQILSDKTIHFDDREEARAVLREMRA